MSELQDRYKELLSATEIETGRMTECERRLEEHSVALKENEKELKVTGEETDILRVVGEIQREKVRGRVEALVTKGLRSVFGRSDYRFELDMQIKRGQMTATPMLASNFKGTEILLPIKEAKGGGIVNVAAFLQREIVRALTRPKLARINISDEPFSNVSREYLPKIAELLAKLHEVTGVQFVIVTHKSELAEGADKVFEVSQDDQGRTKIKVQEC